MELASLLTLCKLERFSAPNLVVIRRVTFREYAKAKLLDSPLVPYFNDSLTLIDAELKRRNITIKDPELL